MAEQIFQIGVKALIRNASGHILMVHLPARNGKPAYWDLPGGRVDGEESFEQTLLRELKEEIGIDYTGATKQLMTVKSKIKIPVGDQEVPLIFIIYAISLPADAQIKINPEDKQDDFAWFGGVAAANNIVDKFSPEFCDFVSRLA